MVNNTGISSNIYATKKSTYDTVAPVYDILGEIWTCGNIRKSKHWQLRFLKANDTVLFAGAGSGDEALHAALQGVHVVIIDISSKMLSRAKHKFLKAGVHNAQFIYGDVMDHDLPLHYDAVVANYFLDVFDPATMQAVIQHLKTLLKTNGAFLISGFAAVEGSVIKRITANFFHHVPLIIFHLIAGNALHRVYDYTEPLKELGFVVKEQQYFSIIKNYFPITHSLYALPSSINH
jgi:ubiquinone/menaquinone biosynthesis C-methylase UbiE